MCVLDGYDVWFASSLTRLAAGGPFGRLSLQALLAWWGWTIGVCVCVALYRSLKEGNTRTERCNSRPSSAPSFFVREKEARGNGRACVVRVVYFLESGGGQEVNGAVALAQSEDLSFHPSTAVCWGYEERRRCHALASIVGAAPPFCIVALPLPPPSPVCCHSSALFPYEVYFRT